MTKRDIETARAICEKATAGPWAWSHTSEKDNGYIVGLAWAPDGTRLSGEVNPGGEYDESMDAYIETIGRACGLLNHEAATVNYGDAAFIAAARTLLPQALDELEQARGQLSALQHWAAHEAAEAIAERDQAQEWIERARGWLKHFHCSCGLDALMAELEGGE